MLQVAAGSELDDARKFLLMNLIETYFKLSPDHQKRFRRLVSEEEFREVQEMEVMWADRMRAEGAKEGLVEGKRQALLLLLLAKKFGPLSEEVTAQVRALESVDELDVYLDRVLAATSLEEMKLDALHGDGISQTTGHRADHRSPGVFISGSRRYARRSTTRAFDSGVDAARCEREFSPCGR